ncbi:MAG TPA: malate dehydrogenase, partial [Chthoniobacteraceae bacterium]|nr:malate dehydrogenase [Chthoniobacteraceae bacterium]
AMNHAKAVPSDRWFAMTRLDENRAKTQLARKAGVDVTAVTNLAVWGNHSPTMYPDFYNARIHGTPVPEVIHDQAWLEGEFLATVQQRGAAIIKARGASSAASAANAVVDTVRSLCNQTPEGDWHSVSVHTTGDYDIPAGIISSFPIRTLTNGTFEIAKWVPINGFSRSKIEGSIAELLEEKAMVAELLQ